MQQCANVKISISNDGVPVVVFETTQHYLDLPPLKQALLAHTAVQMGTMVVKQIIASHPEHCDEICAHIQASSLQSQTEAGAN